MRGNEERTAPSERKTERKQEVTEKAATVYDEIETEDNINKNKINEGYKKQENRKWNVEEKEG